MTARRWWLLVAATIVVGVGVWTVLSVRSAATDCAAVQNLIEYNKAHNERIAAQTGGHVTELPLSEYENWAAQIREYAVRINDPNLQPHARRISELADRTVSVVKSAREDESAPGSTGPPAWVREYADMNDEYTREIDALQKACSTA